MAWFMQECLSAAGNHQRYVGWLDLQIVYVEGIKKGLRQIAKVQAWFPALFKTQGNYAVEYIAVIEYDAVLLLGAEAATRDVTEASQGISHMIVCLYQ